MTELKYIPNSNPWPMNAEHPNYSLRFSGTFEPARLEARRFDVLYGKGINALLIAFASLGGLILIVQAYQELPHGNALFFIQKGFSNYLIFVGIYCALYLYARVQQRNVAANKFNYLENGSEKTIDVYQLFDTDVENVWNAAGEQSHKFNESIESLLLQQLSGNDKVAEMLQKLKVDSTELRGKLKKLPPDNRSVLEIPYIAFIEALKIKAGAITAPVLFLAVTKHAYENEAGLLTKALRDLGINPEALERTLSIN